MCLYTSGYLTVSRYWYFNVHFRFLGNVSRFLKYENSPYFILRLQLSVSIHKKNWIHTMYLQNVIFSKNTPCTLTSQEKFWHKWDLKNVYNLFFLKQYQLTSNIYTFKESKAYKRENNTTVLSGIYRHDFYSV